MLGTIISLRDSYGFIRNAGGETFYFNKKSLTTATQFGWIAAFVTLLDKPDFEWEEGALYVERAGKTFTMWRAGDEPKLGVGQRLLESLEYATDFRPNEGLVIDHFRAMAAQAGANFARDVKVEVAVKLVGGFAMRSYRCTGVFGVMVKPLKVKNPREYTALQKQFSTIIDTRLRNLQAFRERQQATPRELLAS